MSDQDIKLMLLKIANAIAYTLGTGNMYRHTLVDALHTNVN